MSLMIRVSKPVRADSCRQVLVEVHQLPLKAVRHALKSVALGLLGPPDPTSPLIVIYAVSSQLDPSPLDQGRPAAGCWQACGSLETEAVLQLPCTACSTSPKRVRSAQHAGFCCMEGT